MLYVLLDVKNPTEEKNIKSQTYVCILYVYIIVIKNITTPSNGSLGSRIDEERSEMWNVFLTCKSREASNFRTQCTHTRDFCPMGTLHWVSYKIQKAFINQKWVLYCLTASNWNKSRTHIYLFTSKLLHRRECYASRWFGRRIDIRHENNGCTSLKEYYLFKIIYNKYLHFDSTRNESDGSLFYSYFLGCSTGFDFMGIRESHPRNMRGIKCL